MSFLNKLGRIFGLFVSVFIITAVFLSYLSIDIMSYSVFSMSLFEINRIGAIIIIVLAMLSFIASYNSKGFLISFLGIIILAANVYFACHISFGNEQIDSIVNQLTSILGDFFTPGIGFIVISVSSIVLFLSGLMINKEKGEDSKKLSKKAKIIIASVLVLVCVGAGSIICFVYPGYYFKSKMVVDERTGKKFDIVDGKVQIYLPTKIVSYSNGKSYNDFDISYKYDNKARLTEKSYQGHNNNGEVYNYKTSFTYDIDGNLKHVTDGGTDTEFVDDWTLEYKDGYIKTITREEKTKQRDMNGSITRPYIYHEYNTNGLQIDSYSSTLGYNNGEKIDRSLHSFQYDENGIMKRLEDSGDFKPCTIDFSYENGLINETVLEGKSMGEYWYNKASYTRENNKIVEIYNNSIQWGNTTDETVKYTYDEGKLTKIEFDEEYSMNNGGYQASILVDLKYDDKYIKSYSYSLSEDNDNNYIYESNYEYENGEIISVKSKSNIKQDDASRDIKIEYDLFDVPLEDWNEWYNDYYYSCRYQTLYDTLKMNFGYRFAGFYELYEGYFDQYSEYCSLGYCEGDLKDDEWFGWVTLPKVIGRKYYSINEE